MKTSCLFLLLSLAVVGARADDLPPINAVPTGLTLPGKMIWADLYTKNPAGEIQFYTELFGWNGWMTITRGPAENRSTIYFPTMGSLWPALSSGLHPMGTAPGKAVGISYAIARSPMWPKPSPAPRILAARPVHPAKNIPQRGNPGDFDR